MPSWGLDLAMPSWGLDLSFTKAFMALGFDLILDCGSCWHTSVSMLMRFPNPESFMDPLLELQTF